MAQIKLNIPDPVFEIVVESFAKAHGWRSEGQDGPAGMFAGESLVETIMATLRHQHGEAAAATARQEAIDEVNQNVVITLE